jgi:SulP family sulfate permease
MLKTYNKDQFLRDIVAGVLVALTSLPISLSLAIAAGVVPEKGIYASIIAGIFVSIFGGSRVCIGGISIAIITVISSVISSFGFDGLVIAGIMAGIIIVLIGVFNLGQLIRFIPYTITLGFTCGVSAILFVGQIKDFFGMRIQNLPPELIPRLFSYSKNASSINNAACFIAILTLITYFVWKRFASKIPVSPIICAIIIPSIITFIFNVPVNTIGSIYPNMANTFSNAHIPAITMPLARDLFPSALTIAVLASIESLLAAVVSDGISGDTHNVGTELVGVGMANIVSAIFGGIPVSVSLVKSRENIKQGAKTPVSGIISAIALCIIFTIFILFVKMIPLPTLAAIMFIISVQIADWKSALKVITNSSTSERVVLLITFLLTILFDLVFAIEVGIIAAAFLFLGRLSDNVQIRKWDKKAPSNSADDAIELPDGVMVVDIVGPLFFGSTNKISNMEIDPGTKVIIYRFGSVPAVDASAIHALRVKVANAKISDTKIILSHVLEKPYKIMEKEGLIREVGEGNIRPNIKDSLEYAKTLL